jgi:hypothetical protein
VRVTTVLLGFAVVIAAVACGEGNAPSSPTSALSPGASASATHPPADGEFQGEAPHGSPATPDEYGDWTTFQHNGVSVEIPFGSRFEVRLGADPCFGDGRYWIGIQDSVTGERLRVHMVNPRVLSSSTAARPQLEPVMERILRSAKGTYRIPEYVKTFGPSPTEDSCLPDANPTFFPIPTYPPERANPPAEITPAAQDATPPDSPGHAT